MPLPKRIHFIWAGGEKILPEENAQRIKEWANKNPGFEICLWIDKETTSKEKLDEYYSRYKFNENPKIELLDITEEAVVDEYARYHIDKLSPNYGASSDILRYSILSKYGGAYFDSDIVVREDTKPLNYDGLFDSSETEILRISQFTQNHNAIGNDAIICTPEHPFINDLYKTSKQNHQLKTEPSTSPYKFWELNNLMDWTIKTTGPGAVVKVCLSHDMLEMTNSDRKVSESELTYSKGKEYYQKTKDVSLKLDRACYMPTENNEHNWLNIRPRKCSYIEEAIKIAMESIRFEVTQMGLLIIDHHISEIVKALGIKSTINEKNEIVSAPTREEIEIANKLIKKLIDAQLDLTNCKLIQLISRYQCVSDYYNTFTPNLHDGDIDLSQTEIYRISNNVDGETRQLLISNYLSHIYAQVEACFNSSEIVEDSHVYQLAKTHIVDIVEDYVCEGEDLFLAKDNLFGLGAMGLLARDREWLIDLAKTLCGITQLASDNSHYSDLEIIVSSLRKVVYEHLTRFPTDKSLITTVLYSLYSNEVVFNRNKIVLDTEQAKLIYQLRDEISKIRIRLKNTDLSSGINVLKQSSKFPPYSPEFFRQTQPDSGITGTRLTLASLQDNSF